MHGEIQKVVVTSVVMRHFFILPGVSRACADFCDPTAVSRFNAAFPEPVLFDVDESFFWGARKGKRRRGAAGKVPVFGILKRGGRGYIQIIGNTKTATFLPIIRQKLQPDSVVYTDSYRSYNALDISEFKPYRINHSKLFADQHNHINGIENFWSQAKRVLRKYKGIPVKCF